MTDTIEKYKNIERQMMAMRKFFAEYFRRTTNSIIDKKDDISFLELKGLAAFIDDNREYSVSEISNLVHLPLPNITAIINRLEKKKIVKKQRDNKDGRIVRVALTKKGKKLRYDFMSRRVLEVKGLLDRLTEQEQSDLVNALETATKIFQKI
ncbi:MAG: MarR family transcriptional regulator [Proteobacteria bacterium]|nr:MarR family transcriptional regulator [Pseudomonadota bacterium]